MGVGAALGFGAALPVVTSMGSATAVGAGAAGGSLLGSTLIQQLLGQFGGMIFQGLLGGGQSPFEQQAASDLQARQGLIGQLQQQAAGQPTAGTRAASRQLSSQVQRAQQSFAASASRQGIAGTTPARAQQGRLQAAKIEGMGNIMGASQIAATQQLSGLLSGAPRQQMLAEVQRREAQSGFLSMIGNTITESKLQKQQGVLDSRLEQIIQALLDAISGTQQSLAG